MTDLAIIGRYRWLLVLVVPLLLATGYLVGAARSGVQVHSGMAQSGEGAITIQADGWAYDVPLDVMWTDSTGTVFRGSRPDCLPPSDEELGPITFGAVDVSLGGAGFRQVVWVSCDYQIVIPSPSQP